MRRLSAFLIVSLCVVLSSRASALEVSSCDDVGMISLNSVVEMKTYVDGSVKVFAIDQIEPAAAAFGIAVAIDRGDSLENWESYCRYISGLSDVTLKTIKSSFGKSNGILTLEIAVRSFDGDDGFSSKTLRLNIDKDSKTEAGLVEASFIK